MDLLVLLKLFLIFGIINYLVPLLSRIKRLFVKGRKRETKRERENEENE